MDSKKFILPFGLVALALGGCVTYKATLTNAQGQTMTCEASGKNGLITGPMLRQGFDDCVNVAEAKGYKQAQPASQDTAQTKQ